MESQPFHCSIGNFPKSVELNPPVPCGSSHVLGQSLEKFQGKWWKGGKAVWQQSSASNLKQVPQILPVLCSCPCSDSLPTPKPGIFVLKNLSGRAIHEPSPLRAPGLGMPSLPVVFARGRPLWITKLEMYRWKGFFPQIKLYTNRSLLNYPTNIPQTRQQKNQSTTKSTNTKWKSSGNYCNGNEGSGNKLTPSSSQGRCWMGTEGVPLGRVTESPPGVPCSCSAAERILAVVDGVAQLLQHDVQRGVLGQLDHEHARLHSDVPRIRGPCATATARGYTQPNTATDIWYGKSFP